MYFILRGTVLNRMLFHLQLVNRFIVSYIHDVPFWCVCVCVWAYTLILQQIEPDLPTELTGIQSKVAV